MRHQYRPYPPARGYVGIGQIEPTGRAPIVGRFRATQDHDGELTLRLHSFDHAAAVLGFGDVLGGSPTDGFSGVTRDGRKVRIYPGPMSRPAETSLRSPGGVRLVFRLSGPGRNLEVGDPDFTADGGSFRFQIANLHVQSRAITQVAPGHLNRGVEVLDVAGVSVTVNRNPQFDEHLARLKAGVDVRLTAEFQIPDSLGLERAIELAGDLCDLYSIARGTLVSWLWVDWHAANGGCRYSYHHPAITRPYASGLPLIEAGNDKAFITSTLESYRRLRMHKDFRAVARALVEVRGGGFLDSRALLCGSVIEMILGHDAVEHGEAQIFNDADFAAGLSALQAGMRELIAAAYPSATDDQTSRLAGQAQGFNLTSFGSRLTRTSKRLGVDLSRQDIDRLMRTRNRLVHGLTFSTPERYDEYTHLVSVADKLVMGFLGYTGLYWDVARRRSEAFGRHN